MEDLTFGEQVKIILGRKGMTIKELAETIEKETGKKMSRQNLTQRLGRDNFQEQDMRMIAQILGCQFHLSIMVAEGENEETQGETVVRYEQKPKAHKKHISDEGVPEQLELDLFFDKDPEEAEPTGSAEAEETTAAQETVSEPEEAEETTVAQEVASEPEESEESVMAQEVASEPEESEESVMVQEVASEPEESEESVIAQAIEAEPVEEEAADTEEAPVYEEETADSPEEEAPVYSAAEESAYSTDAEQVSAYSTDTESDSDYETEQIYADRTPAIQVEPLHPETMGEDERDMTIGELYDIHKELSDLEENARAGEPVEEIKKELEKPKKEKFRGLNFFSRKKKAVKEESAPVEETPAYAEEEKEPYRAEENNAADEGYSSYEEQEEYGQPEYASDEYQSEYQQNGYEGTGYETDAYQSNEYGTDEYASEGYQEAAYENAGYEQNDAGYEPEYEQGDAGYQQGEDEFQPVIPHADEEEDRELGDVNPYTGKEYQSNSVRMHPTRIGYVQVYDRTIHKWTDMTEWAFLGYQERKKVLLGKAYEPPIYLD